MDKSERIRNSTRHGLGTEQFRPRDACPSAATECRVALGRNTSFLPFVPGCHSSSLTDLFHLLPFIFHLASSPALRLKLLATALYSTADASSARLADSSHTHRTLIHTHTFELTRRVTLCLSLANENRMTQPCLRPCICCRAQIGAVCASPGVVSSAPSLTPPCCICGFSLRERGLSSISLLHTHSRTHA